MPERRVGLQALDAAAYALVLTAVVFTLGLAAGLAVGNGLIGAKWLMFGVGFLLLGYGTLRLRPTAKWKEESRLDLDDEARGLQRAVSEALPAAYRLPPDDRPSVGLKLFLGALAVLATSFALEAVFGVGVGI